MARIVADPVPRASARQPPHCPAVSVGFTRNRYRTAPDILPAVQ